MIHLDTSFLIRALVRGSPEDQRLREWLSKSEPLTMSTIAWAEFLCGPIDKPQLKLATGVIRRRSNFTPGTGNNCRTFVQRFRTAARDVY